MGETIPPVSKSQPAAAREEDDPHESVTIAPPAPSFDALLRAAGPTPLPTRPSDANFRAALDAGTRAGVGLSELTKVLSDLSGGVVSAKQANEQLVEELATLHAMLGSANEQQLSMKQRLSELEQELVASQLDAERERTFLTEQHDEFLSALLDEHEEALLAHASDAGDTTRMSAELSDMAQKLVVAESGRVSAEEERERARAAVTKAQMQRDEAQARANRLERERDELRAESSMLRARLGTLRSASTTPPPPAAGSRPPSYRPPNKLRLDASELDSTLHARPRLPSLPGRLTPPPPELERAVYGPSGSIASAFPRESTRPGVGGPKPSQPPPPPDFGPPPSGWTPVPPAPAVTPAAASFTPQPRAISVASMPPVLPGTRPALKQKPDPTTRPLISYSLGKDNVESEMLEGARLSSKPPRK